MPTLSARAARTRTALLEAGLTLLADRPMEAIAIDEVVASAGVAKGSFFNHFDDKHLFARAVADGIRHDLEVHVAAANDGSPDPLDRLVGGMVTTAAFAVAERRKAAVLFRSASGMTAASHPLNRGVIEDVRLAVEAGLVDPEAKANGYLFWLGCCQVVVGAIAEGRPSVDDAISLIGEMCAMGLRGLGAEVPRIQRLASRQALCERFEAALRGFRPT